MASTSSLESLAEQTQTLVETVEITPGENEGYGVVTPGEGIADHLKIRVIPRRRQRATKSVRWSGDVIDNEFLGRKSSKKCCIFHKRQQFGSWSDSDTEDECDCDKSTP